PSAREGRTTRGAAMSNPYAISRKLAPMSGTTTDLRPDRSTPSKPGTLHKLRCKIACGGSQPHQTTEIAPLLRYRLRIATLITLAAFSIYLVRGFMHLNGYHGSTSLGLAIHSAVVAVMVLLACALWTTYPLSVRALRSIELTLFGVAALFFIYLHFAMFSDGHVLEWAKDGYQTNVASLAITASTLRWFILIVLYGTFVPNTWKRCATVVGLLAAIPLTL